MPVDDRTLDALERRALADFIAPDPPEDFSERVLARVEAAGAVIGPLGHVRVDQDHGRRGGGLVAGVAIAAAAAAVAAASLSARGPAPLAGSPGAPTAEIEARGDFQASPLPQAPDSPGTAAPAPPDLGERVSAYLEGYGRAWGDAFRLHGAVAIARGGEVLFERAYGAAADRPSPPRFHLGTLTGQITAIAALQLAERGRVDLDASICTYVPEYCRHHRAAGGEVITPRHLLSHTSGVPNYTDDLYLEIWSRHPTTTAEVIAVIAEQPLEFAPGSDFDPSNSGYLLLGEVIARASGERYEDYVARHVLGPAGMSDTTFGADLGDRRRVAGREFNDELEVLELAQAAGAGAAYHAASGLWSTTTDLVRLDDALTRGALLAPATREAMATPVRESYGLGWILGRAHGQRTIGHPGGAAGSNGAILRLEGDGTFVVALAATEVVDCQAIAEDLLAIVHGRRPSPPPEPVAAALDPSAPARVIGEYALSPETRRRYAEVIDADQLARLERVQIVAVDGRLRMEVPGHGGKWMHPAGGDRYFFKDTARTLAEFTRGEDGGARALTLRAADAIFVLDRSSR